MQGPCHHFLAAAGLTQQQHRQVIGQALARHAQGTAVAAVAHAQRVEVRLAGYDLGRPFEGTGDGDWP
ncbi:hypothetical protein D3C85_1088080 [compost metagenome]